MRAAMRVEALKLAHSLVGVIATLAVVAGMLALLGGITAGVAGGNPEMVAKAGPAGALNWDGLLAGAAQITAVASILGFGIVLSWMFGREFTEGTVTGLFALPVTRTRIALAKLTVYALWATVVSVALTAGVLVLGLTLAYGPPSKPDLGRTWTGTRPGTALCGNRRTGRMGRDVQPIVARGGWMHSRARGDRRSRRPRGSRRLDAAGRAGAVGHVRRNRRDQHTTRSCARSARCIHRIGMRVVVPPPT